VSPSLTLHNKQHSVFIESTAGDAGCAGEGVVGWDAEAVASLKGEFLFCKGKRR
jgi:hypothetical protein